MYIVYSKPACPQCVNTKALLETFNLSFEVKMLGEDYTREELLELIPTARMMPQIIHNGIAIGSYKELVESFKKPE